jgi:hypothetical protein
LSPPSANRCDGGKEAVPAFRGTEDRAYLLTKSAARLNTLIGCLARSLYGVVRDRAEREFSLSRARRRKRLFLAIPSSSAPIGISRVTRATSRKQHLQNTTAHPIALGDRCFPNNVRASPQPRYACRPRDQVSGVLSIRFGANSEFDRTERQARWRRR